MFFFAEPQHQMIHSGDCNGEVQHFLLGGNKNIVPTWKLNIILSIKNFVLLSDTKMLQPESCGTNLFLNLVLTVLLKLFTLTTSIKYYYINSKYLGGN